MTRLAQVLVIAVAVATVASAGCEKKSRNAKPAPDETDKPAPDETDKPTPPGPQPSDAGIDEMAEPKVPPPPPTVKEGGNGRCKTDYAPRPRRDPNPMCKVRGEKFMMGSPEGEGRANEHPQHEVEVGDFYIDQFEVTVAQVMHYLNAVGSNSFCPSTGSEKRCFSYGYYASPRFFREEAGGRFVAAPGRWRLPMPLAYYEGAEKYCAWVGKRVPTEAEWEYAARHHRNSGEDFRYPWGDKFQPRRAACREDACRDGFDDENVHRLAPVGSFDGSSPSGVHDMAGNALEWTADCYRSYAEPIEPEGPGCERAVRSLGGAFGRAETIRAAVRDDLAQDTFSGFRCARDAP